MTTLRRAVAATAAGLGLLTAGAGAGFADPGMTRQAASGQVQLAHMGQGYGHPFVPYGYGYGPCPGMGPGFAMGPGMMMGPGMGMMGHGMMGPGMGMMGPGYGSPAAGPGKDLSADDVRERLEHSLAWQGNKRLKVGSVKEVDEDTILAEIVTVDDSLVQRIEVNRHSGRTQPVE